MNETSNSRSLPCVLSYTQANESIEKNGQQIVAGKETTRFGVQGSDSSFFISAVVIKAWLLTNFIAKIITVFGQHIKLNSSSEGTILLNINSLSKRLHMSRKAILAAAAKGNLEELIQNRTNRIQKVLEKNKVISTNLKQTKPADLVKNIKFITLLFKNVPSSVFEQLNPSLIASKMPSPSQDAKVDLIDRCIEIVTEHNKRKEKERPASSVQNRELTVDLVLGKGGFGKVYRTTIGKAIKCARTKFKDVMRSAERDKLAKHAKQDLQNETTLSREINKEGPVWGLELAPSEVVEWTITKTQHRLPKKPDESRKSLKNLGVTTQDPSPAKLTKTKVGSTRDQYDMDGARYAEQVKNAPFEEKLIVLHQILSGLGYCLKEGIVHRDIKLQNILIAKTTNDTLIASLSDLGGARKVPDTNEPLDLSKLDLDHLFEIPRTYSYCLAADVQAFEKLLSKCRNLQKRKEDFLPQLKELIALDKKRDIFATGMTLYYLLDPQNNAAMDYHPYALMYIGRKGDAYRDITKAVPQEIKDLVKDMLDPNPENRPDDALERLENFIQVACPEQFNKILKAKLQFVAGKSEHLD